MQLIVKFEDADHFYEVDFAKVLKKLNISMEDVKLIIDELIRKS